LLLLLASRSAAPAAAGGVAAAGSGASLGLLLPLMWRVGGVLLPGLWRQQLLQLAWLLLCCSSQQVRTAVCCTRRVQYVLLCFVFGQCSADVQFLSDQQCGKCCGVQSFGSGWGCCCR
jgi:hypothetical protein